MLSLTPVLLSFGFVLVGFTLSAAGSDGAASPPLRTSVPAHVPAPPHTTPRPARVVPDHGAATPAAEKVNINTADVKALMTLAGVSRKVAQQIVAYRDEHGPFKRGSELKKVDGVSDTVWEKNRRRIVTK